MNLQRLFELIGLYALVLFILTMIVCPITCEGAEKPWTTISGIGIQFEGSLSDLEDVHMYLGGVRRNVFSLHFGKFAASIEPEIFGGYRLNGSNGWLIALQPVFRFAYSFGNFEPYINLIIGISYNDMNIEGMGMDFNFSPTAGIGILWSGWKVIPLLLEYRIIHLSNAGLHENNEGLNMHSLFIGRKF